MVRFPFVLPFLFVGKDGFCRGWWCCGGGGVGGGVGGHQTTSHE